MNDHNLDDLIIDNKNTKSSKSKNLLTIIALAIIVLIIAIILTKSILKNPEDHLQIDEDNITDIISPDLTLQTPSQEETVEETTKKSENNIKEKLSLEKETALKSEQENISQKEETLNTKKQNIADISIEKIDTDNINKDTNIKKNTIKTEEKAIAETTTPKRVDIVEDIFEDETETNKEKEEKKISSQKVNNQQKQAKQKKSEEKKTEKEKKKNLNINVTQQPKQHTSSKKTSTTAQKDGRYYIQVGSFRLSPSKQFLSVIKKSGFNYTITPPSNAGTKKLLIGPYPSKASANSALPRVKDRINKGAFVIKK